jgi:aspartyl-tRNA(Asn)/glutamyl-tRNA(Gln) amidotransferase subunit C
LKTSRTFSSISEPPETVDKDTVILLEKLSLVDFGNQAGVQRLQEAVRFAEQLLAVDTSDVKPMVTPLEDIHLYLREDKVDEGNCKDVLLGLASKTLDDYFIAPPGNIALEPSGEYKS